VLVVEDLAERRELDAHLGGRGQFGGVQRVEQGQVLVRDGLGLRRVGGVLAEVVDGHSQAVVDQFATASQRVVDLRAGDEAAHHVAADRGTFDEPLDPVGAGGGKNHLAQHARSVPAC
jgi:hypothetical protein